MFIVREIREADAAAWRRLWTGYNDFYETSVADPVTDHTLHRLLDPASPVVGRIAENNGRIVGFAIFVLHESTWTTSPSCYLEDLFVDPSARGAGAGHALIQDLIDLGRSRGWSRVYWHTRATNEKARRLYDRFVEADDFVRYRLTL